MSKKQKRSNSETMKKRWAEYRILKTEAETLRNSNNKKFCSQCGAKI